MLRLAAVILALSATASAQPPSAASGARAATEPRSVRPDARLAPSPGLVLEGRAGARAVAVDAARDAAAPVRCPVDWCQPRVDVPGLELARARISRPELVATLLDDADLAPLASLVWVLASTGLELDWRPAQLDATPGAAASGRGSLMLWLKLRLDAWNRPSFPARERVPEAAQRPARLSST